MDSVHSFLWRWLQSMFACDPSSWNVEALEKIRGLWIALGKEVNQMLENIKYLSKHIISV